MKIAEIRDLGVTELRAKEKDLDDLLFRLRIQKSMGQLEAPAKVRDVRRDRAKVKTILREKTAVASGQ
ncbi:MAG: 50S ribosomal protein L29 [Acidobacteria bacterium]|nr:50S ribosomal protein L29 [Acidobacteriota bacterium]